MATVNWVTLPRETFVSDKVKQFGGELSRHDDVNGDNEENQTLAEPEDSMLNNETSVDNKMLDKSALVEAEALMDLANAIGLSPLLIAAQEDLTQMTRRRLERNIPVNWQHRDGISAYELAVLHGHYSVVLALLDGGAAVNIVDVSGQTLFLSATQEGRPDIVSLLRNRKASVNYRNWTGATALCVACECGELAIVRDLLISDASVDLINDRGCTLAAKHGDGALARLLNWNANVNLAYSSKETALTLACDNGHMDVIGVLLAAGADVHGANGAAWAPLMRTAQKACADVGQVMLDELVNTYREHLPMTNIQDGKLEVNIRQQREKAVNRQELNKATALWIAAEHGQEEIVAGASIEIADAIGNTPLMIAAHEGHLDIVELLLDRRIDIEKKCYDGFGALEISAKAGHLEVVRALLNGGASIDQDDAEGWTPLIRAARDGHAEVVRLLLDCGAAVNSQDHNGGTALRIAALNNHPKVVRLLLDEGAAIDLPDNTGWTPLLAAVFENSVEIVQLLLDQNANTESRVQNEATAMIVASEYGYTRVIQALLAAGAVVDATDDDGWTALMCAAHGGRVDIAEMLLTEGADIEVHNLGGFSALVIAVVNHHLDVVRLLLEHGADIQWQDYASGTTLLSLAYESGNGEVVQLIHEQNYLRYR